MRLVLASIFGATLVGLAQAPPAPAEHGTLRLHYVQKPIGYERYDITRDAGENAGFQLTSDFDFTDRRGRESVAIGEKTLRLERFVIDGVVWGRETLWLDEDESLAAAITRAGGLSFEAVREDLESALVAFVQRATFDRLADLELI